MAVLSALLVQLYRNPPNLVVDSCPVSTYRFPSSRRYVHSNVRLAPGNQPLSGVY
jgi:hypothetical protein